MSRFARICSKLIEKLGVRVEPKRDVIWIVFDRFLAHVWATGHQ